ncbi:MAG: hypothetical protein GY811_28815 [Myxococcales bacterium]|nr:hypothetical protein [Myxococcales bacterium]
MNKLNRRASERIREPHGIAVCRTLEGATNYQIQDTSLHGVSLYRGPKLDLGIEIFLDISWPMIGRARGRGTISRHFGSTDSAPNMRLGVRFTEAPEIGELWRELQTLKELRSIEAMPLVCGTSSHAERLIHELKEAGFPYSRALCPLDAISELQNPCRPISSVVFMSTLPWTEFAFFLRDEFPDQKRVLLANPKSEDTDRSAIRAGIADSALRSPWLAEDAYTTLGLKLSRHTCFSCDSRLANLETPFCLNCLDRSTDLCETDDLGRCG